MKMIMNKKGQNSTIGVIIAVVLGIALIVFLIWGFSTNWSMFRDTSGAYSGQVNIDTVKQACAIQCDNGQKDEFCNVKKPVTYSNTTTNKVVKGDFKCSEAPLSVECSKLSC